MDDQILVAAKTGVVNLHGRRVKIRAGATTTRAGSPLHRGRENMFKLLSVDDQGVEQATASPGESRDVIRPEKAELLAEAAELGLNIHPNTKLENIRAQIDAARQESEGGPSVD